MIVRTKLGIPCDLNLNTNSGGLYDTLNSLLRYSQELENIIETKTYDRKSYETLGEINDLDMYMHLTPALNHLLELMRISTETDFRDSLTRAYDVQVVSIALESLVICSVFIFMARKMNQQFQRVIKVFKIIHPALLFGNPLLAKRVSIFFDYSISDSK